MVKPRFLLHHSNTDFEDVYSTKLLAFSLSYPRLFYRAGPYCFQYKYPR